MKLLILLLTLTFALSCSQRTTFVSKPLIYDAHGNIISGRFTDPLPQTTVTFKDNSLNCTYVLDSSHIYVSAYDSVGKLLWKIDPYIGNLNSYDRATRTISNIYFGESTDILRTTPYKVLWVRYGRAGGYLDLKTGRFRLDKL